MFSSGKKKPLKRLTRNQIAAMAGVSPSTVSRALSGSPLIPEKTASKIRELAIRHNYIPDFNARKLASRMSWQIGFAIEFRGERIRRGPIQIGYYSAILDGVISSAFEQCWSVLIQPYESDSLSSAKKLLYQYKSRQIDGLIFAGLRIKSKMLPFLHAQSVPIVLVGSIYKDLPYVDIDFESAYAEAFMTLLTKKCKDCIFVEGDNSYRHAIIQKKAFIKQAKHFSVNIKKVLKGDYSMRCGYKLAKEILSISAKGDCVFFANDRMAAGFYRYCSENKIQIPERIRVIGSDRDPIAVSLFPSLSTIAQPRSEMGREACQLMLKTIRGEKTFPIILKQNFIQGESI